MSPSPLLMTKLLAGHLRRLLAIPFAAVLYALPPHLLARLLLRRRRPEVAGGLGWAWSIEIRKILADVLFDFWVTVPCRVLRRKGCKDVVIPLSRRMPLPFGYRPSVN